MQPLEDFSSVDFSHDTSTSATGDLERLEGTQPPMSKEEKLPNTSFTFQTQNNHLNCARMVVAEFVGTFILVFSISGVIASMELMGVKLGLLEYAFTAGSAIVVIVFTIGSISGAHINPAGTIAFAVWGHFPWVKVPFYIGAQLLGSIMATYMGKLVYGVKPEVLLTQPILSTTSAFWAEFIATFIIIFLAASLARDAKIVGQLSGIVMGIAIALAVLITGPISGASMNPARSLGPAIVEGKFDRIWIYFLAPTAGAIAGISTVHALCVHSQPPQSVSSTPIISLLSCRAIQTQQL